MLDRITLELVVRIGFVVAAFGLLSLLWNLFKKLGNFKG